MGLLGRPNPACAAPEAGAASLTTPARPVVSIVVVGDEAAFQRILPLQASHALDQFETRWQRMDRLEVVDILERGKGAGVALHCYADLRTPSDIRLYFVDRDTERFLLRRLPLPEQSEEMDREILAQVIELSLRALIEEKDTGLSRDEAVSLLRPPEPAPPPPPPRPIDAPPPPPAPSPPARSWTVEADLRYTLRLHSQQVPWLHGPQAAVWLGYGSQRLVPKAGMALGYTWHRRYQTRQAGLDFQSVTPMLAGRLDGAVGAAAGGGPMWLGGHLGVGLELVDVSPLQASEGPPVALADRRMEALPVILLGLDFSVALQEHLALLLVASTLVDPSRVRYGVELPTGNHTVLTRYRVQPMLGLGVSVR